MPPPTKMPRKEKPLSKVKTPLPQRPKKEAIAETSGEVPPAEFMTIKPIVVLVVTPVPKERKSCGNMKK